MHDILHFISACYQAGNAERVRSEFATLIREYGFEYFLVSRRMTGELASTGQILAQHLPEGWIEVYRAKKYNLVDPVRKVIGMCTNPFIGKRRWRGFPAPCIGKGRACFSTMPAVTACRAVMLFPCMDGRDS